MNLLPPIVIRDKTLVIGLNWQALFACKYLVEPTLVSEEAREAPRIRLSLVETDASFYRV